MCTRGPQKIENGMCRERKTAASDEKYPLTQRSILGKTVKTAAVMIISNETAIAN